MPENPLPITIPLLNPNEPEATLASLEIREGQAVSAGEILCTLETTKSTAEVEAPAAGYIVALYYQAGDLLRAGETLCYLADSPDWQPETSAERPGSRSAPAWASAPPEGLRITRPALALAQEHGFDLENLPRGPLVTEQTLRELLAGAGRPASQADHKPSTAAPAQSPFNPTAIVIYGAGGHGKALADLLRALGSYRLLGFIDDGRPKGEQVLGLPILGGAEALAELYAQGVRLAINAVGGIGNVAIRIKVFKRLAQAGFACPAVIHPSAFVEPSAEIAAGAQIMPHAYVGSEAQIGYGAIVNTGAIVSHDCRLGAYANLSPGAILAGEVTIGEAALVGMGATVNLQVNIGARARIGNGATVKQDVPAQGLVRAGAVWPD